VVYLNPHLEVKLRPTAKT